MPIRLPAWRRRSDESVQSQGCGRILWHEAAEQSVICLGILAVLVTVQASLATMAAFGVIQTPSVAFGFCMALFMTAMYAAASSAILFTADVDAGTFVFHRTKPIGWLTYLWGKLSWTALSSLALGLAAWIETCVWQSVFPGARDASLALGVSGVGIVEGMAGGLIASMMFRGPLRAVIAGIAMASIGAWVSVVVYHGATGGGTVLVTTAYYQAAGLRLIVAAVALASVFPMARVWYRTGQPLRPLVLPRFLRGETRSIATGGDWDSCGQPCRGRAIRLLWQAWRQIQTPAMIYWGMCLVAFVWVGLDYLSKGRFPSLSR